VSYKAVSIGRENGIEGLQGHTHKPKSLLSAWTTWKVHFNVGEYDLKTFDYIIVGAWKSAGCVLANRLDEDPSTTVLFWKLELRPQYLIQMPTALFDPDEQQKICLANLFPTGAVFE